MRRFFSLVSLFFLFSLSSQEAFSQEVFPREADKTLDTRVSPPKIAVKKMKVPYRIADYRLLLNLNWTNQMNSVGAVAAVFISNYQKVKWNKPEEAIVFSYVSQTLPEKIVPTLHKLDPRLKFLRSTQIDFTKIYVFRDDSEWREKIMKADSDFMVMQYLNTVQTSFDVEFEATADNADAITFDLAYNINQRFKDLFDKQKLILILSNKKTHVVNDMSLVRAFRYLGAKNDATTVNYFVAYDEDKGAFVKTYYYPPIKIRSSREGELFSSVSGTDK